VLGQHQAAMKAAAQSRRSVQSRFGKMIAQRDYRWLRPSREYPRYGAIAG